MRELNSLHRRLRACRACSAVCGTPVHGPAMETAVMLIGQAPGVTESVRGRPFAHTAGRTLFKWLGEATALGEEELREQIFISAVARCFPGKAVKAAGDRPPSPEEIAQCRPFLRGEIEIIKPKLILAVGRIAIAETLGPDKFPKSATLADVVGKKFSVEIHGVKAEVIPLPHPSGVSRWTQTEPGKSCLKKALALVRRTALPLLEGQA